MCQSRLQAEPHRVVTVAKHVCPLLDFCPFDLSQILVESQGGTWNESTSEARNYQPPLTASSSSSTAKSAGGQLSSSQSFSNFGGYQNGGGGGVPNFNSREFKAQKEDFFSRKQMENSSRPE